MKDILKIILFFHEIKKLNNVINFLINMKLIIFIYI